MVAGSNGENKSSGIMNFLGFNLSGKGGGDNNNNSPNDNTTNSRKDGDPMFQGFSFQEESPMSKFDG